MPLSGRRKVVLLSAVSGAVWAAIALLLGWRVFRGTIWGGVAVAPLIGVLAGFGASHFPTGPLPRALFSLLSLYIAAALFGGGIGTAALLVGPNSGPGWQAIPAAVLVQNVVATLWGITITGYLVLLWPLSHVNHHLLSQAWAAAKGHRHLACSLPRHGAK